MATHTGSEGTVKVGSNAIGEVRSFTLNITGETIEDTALGDTARSYKAGLTDGTASVEMFFDEDALSGSTGQGELDVGSSITLNLYPAGDTVGTTFYSGTALITGKTVTGSFDGMVEMSCEVQFTGGITQADVSA